MERRQHWAYAALLLLALAAFLAACGGEEAEVVEVTRVVTETETEAGEQAEVTRVVIEATEMPEVGPQATATGQPGAEASGTEPGGGARPAEVGPGTGPKTGGGTSVAPVSVGELPRDAGAAPAGDVAPGGSVAPTPAPTAAWRLIAGAVDDNAAWSDYLAYRAAYDGPPVLPADVSERYPLRVVDRDGNPLLGAAISVTASGVPVAVLRTHGDGGATFFPRVSGAPLGLAEYLVRASWNGVETEQIVVAGAAAAEQVLTLPVQRTLPPALPLDVLFLLDATGSMGDELAALKANINAIAAQVDQLPAQPAVRFGLVAYRDRDHSFLTRAVPFTDSVGNFAAALDDIYASGGGDYPEDLHAGLAAALDEQPWRDENAIRLIFLIADAPPHLDYDDQSTTYVTAMVDAAARGIKIFPLAASGINAQGEYIFRQLAQYTRGQFLFLTEADGSAGGAETEAERFAGNDVAALLDELIVQLISAELRWQSPGAP